MGRKEIRNQQALDYTLYMIAGSYFRKAVCDRARLKESQLLLRYKEQRPEVQYLMEELCIGYMEEHLIPRLPEEIWQQEVAVRFEQTSENGPVRVIFSGRGFALSVRAERKGRKKVRMSFRFLRREKSVGEATTRKLAAAA